VSSWPNRTAEDKIKTLREQMRRMNGFQKQLDEQPEPQISLTDPDSRSMIRRAKGTGVVGYNVQVACRYEAPSDRRARSHQRRE